MVPTLAQKQGKNTKSMCCASNYSMFLNEKGSVFAFGNNMKGRMGIEERYGEEIPLPMHVTSLVNISQISCGLWHSLAVDNAGQAWSAGYNNYGELGRPLTPETSDQFAVVNQAILIK